MQIGERSKKKLKRMKSRNDASAIAFARKRQLFRHFRPFFRHLAAAAVFGGLLGAKRVYVHETLLKYGNFE